MSSEPGDRPLGASQPTPDQPLPTRPEDAPEAIPGDAGPPQVPVYSSSSGDELNASLLASLNEPRPDPFLGQLSAADLPTEPIAAFEGPPGESFDAVSTLIGFTDPSPVEPVVGPAVPQAEVAVPAPDPAPPPPASSDSFPAIDLMSPPSSRSTPERDKDEADDEYDDLPAPRASWVTLLLFSYASAVTLGLLWVLLSGRKVRERDEVELAPPVDTRPDPGLRADSSRKVTPPPALAADRLTTLGKTVRMGSLEVTPLEVRSGPVALHRTVADQKREDGGSGALKLMLRLRNVSSDTIFAPLDEAFLREREPGTLDSFIETEQGGQVGMYPLAVPSERAIAGQEFREIGPGQTFETDVVSATDVVDRLTADMTWRVRLRTGIKQTDTLGVRFRKDEIKPSG